MKPVLLIIAYSIMTFVAVFHVIQGLKLRRKQASQLGESGKDKALPIGRPYLITGVFVALCSAFILALHMWTWITGKE